MDMREDGEAGIVFRLLLTALRGADLISEGCYSSLVSREWPARGDFEQSVLDVVDALKRRDYYKLLERIEKGENLIAGEADPGRKAGYEKLLGQLLSELEGLRK